jgi:hypothetical protein
VSRPNEALVLLRDLRIARAQLANARLYRASTVGVFRLRVVELEHQAVELARKYGVAVPERIGGAS